ncbi:MAG TPA: long-chain fatty acid--CoA ligase [Blastocatellia bacterium]
MNLGTLLTNSAERRPESPAFVWGDSTSSYGEADSRTNALARALTGLGIKRGDRIALLMHNCPQVIESFFAAWKLGAAVVPLNAHFVDDEISYHIQDSGAATIMFGPEFGQAMQRLRPELPAVKHFVCTQHPLPGQLSYEVLIASESNISFSPAEVPDDDIAWLFYTSGTTGRPKGAMLSHGNLIFMAVSWVADLMHLEPEDVALHAAPLTHGAGFHAIALVLKGCAQVIMYPPRFNPESLCKHVAAHKVTNTWLVPTQIKMLLGYDLERWDLSSLKWLVYGGAPMHSADITEAIERLGPILVQLYGQGETPMTGTYLRAQDHLVDDRHADRLASCGVARSGTEVRIHDDQGRQLPRGRIGEICVRGPSVMKGYWNRPESSAEALRDGWLWTGDVGRMDDHGFVYILDRNKDMIISGGNNVYPREVEEVLLRHPSIDEVCVIGIPDRVWGERVKALVVLKPGCEATADEIVSFASVRMAGYKKPRAVEFVDSLPRNAYGKVMKRILREQYSSPSQEPDEASGPE